jgi:recombinational DNA repair ATPase RecF
MPLERLSIRDFRGIRALDLDCRGKSFAVLGPNGSGKSSIADALDFLLTGDVKRLRGEGTGNLSLTRHGVNLNGTPATSVVEADFSTGDGKRATLRRRASAAGEFENATSIPAGVRATIELAAQGGQHLLTRREILRYIFTEPRKRGEQVAALLRLTQLDELRKELQGAAKLASDAEKVAAGNVHSRLGTVLRSVDPPANHWEELPARINSLRQSLGAGPVTSLKGSVIRNAVVEPASAGAHPLQSQRTKSLLAGLQPWFDRDAELTARDIVGYLNQVRDVQSQSERLKSMRAADLIASGLSLAVGNECPLCLREWENEELHAFLLQRLEDGRAASEQLTDLREIRAQLRARIAGIASSASLLAAELEKDFEAYAKACTAFADSLRGSLDGLVPDALGALVDPPQVAALTAELAPTTAKEAISLLQHAAALMPSLEGVQRAWDELGAIEASVREYSTAVAEREQSSRTSEQLSKIDQLFLKSRDEVLQRTYDAIADRFAKLYATIHCDDESSFKAALSPTKAGLTLEVDFHDRGEYPPCAVHSEGHQDSMGLCLFLTLAEHLSGGSPPLMILDDVLMSVDRDQRRAVARLLKSEFPNSQFIITTHDRIWWRQLRTVGLIDARGAVEFKTWSLVEGPVPVLAPGDLIQKSRAFLTAGEVPSAAHALRRAAESYLPDISDGLGAKVRFHADGNWSAGDFIDPVLSQYSYLLNRARKAAQNWGKDTGDLDAADERRKAAATSFNTESWAVNANVHFNQWAEFSEQDFAPVLKAYECLFDLFFCETCGSSLQLLEDGHVPVALRCSCGKTNWNLTLKT